MIATLLISFLALSHAQTHTHTEAEVLANAAASVDKYCSTELSELDRAAAIDDLKVGAGEDNFIYTAIIEAGYARQEGQTPKELGTTLAEVTDPGFIVGKAFAVVLSIVLFVLWLICCWFVCCPCCLKCCCKCCQKRRTIGEARLCQAVLWLIFISVGIASLVLVSLTLRGYQNINEGFSGTFCSAAELVQDSISGTENFVGMLPAINRLEEISQALDPTIPNGFMDQVGGIVGSTAKINTAYTQVAQSLKQLQEVVSHAENQAPTGMYHTCAICAPLAEVLAPVTSAFESGIGAALKDARGQVQEQLQGQAAADLQTLLNEAMTPVREAKEQLLEQVGSLVDPTGFQKNTEAVHGENSNLRPAILLLFFLFLILLISGCCALGGFCWKHKPSQKDKDHCTVRTCTCCVSCMGCIYAILVLLLGGILVLVAMVGSGVCLVLVEYNADMAENLFAALGQEVDDTMLMAINISDRCLSANSVAPDASRNLADIVMIQDANGDTVSVRKSIFDTAVTPVQAQFGQVQNLTQMGDLSLSTMPELQTLTQTLAALEMRALFWPDSAAVTADASPYKDMHPAYTAITLSCADVTLSNDLPDGLAGTVTFGMDSMVSTGWTYSGTTFDALTSQMDSLTWTCPSLSAYTCTSGATSTVCDAGAQFVQNIKEPLVTQNKFKCIYQVDPTDGVTICNPRDMTSTGGVWSGQCVAGEDTVQPFKVVDCTIQEFEDNLKNIGLDLTKGFQYFDDTVSGVLNSISVDLINLVDQFIINPLISLLDLFDCTFMAAFWMGLTDSMCLRAMNGLRMIANSYVWVALLSLLIAMLMYVPWRLSKDNLVEFDPSRRTSTRVRYGMPCLEVRPSRHSLGSGSIFHWTGSSSFSAESGMQCRLNFGVRRGEEDVQGVLRDADGSQVALIHGSWLGPLLCDGEVLWKGPAM